VLLDEIEKAQWRRVQRAAPGARRRSPDRRPGEDVDFSNAVLIMTSNLPVDPIEFFKPEFVNRIDEIVRSGRLERGDMAAIVGIQLRHLAGRLASRRLALEVSPETELVVGRTGL